MINLDKSENWSSWEDWVKTKKAHYGSKQDCKFTEELLILTQTCRRI